MKKDCIKILYRLFSFLSDRTNGFKPFVRYKLILGALLIGFTTTSCDNPQQGTYYDPVDTEITCYISPLSDDTTSVKYPSSSVGLMESNQPTDNLDKDESNEITK